MHSSRVSVRKTRGQSNQSTESNSFTNHYRNTLGISAASEIFVNSPNVLTIEKMPTKIMITSKKFCVS